MVPSQDEVCASQRTDSSRPVTVPANHCYLQVEAGVKVLSFLFPDDADHIEGPAANGNPRGPEYDLSGKRIKEKQKG